jgi:hypothetical protein
MVFENIRVQFSSHSRGRGERYTLICHNKRFLASRMFLSLFHSKIHVKSDIFTMSNVSSECSNVEVYFHKVMLKWYGKHCYLKRYGTHTIYVFEIIQK